MAAPSDSPIQLGSGQKPDEACTTSADGDGSNVTSRKPESSRRNRFEASSSQSLFPLPTISIEESPPLPIPLSEHVVGEDEGAVDQSGANVTSEIQPLQGPIDEKNLSTESHSLSSGESGERDKPNEIPGNNEEREPGRNFEPRMRRDNIRNRFSLRMPPKEKSDNFRKALSEEGTLNELQAEDLEKRLKALAAAFSRRTIRTKERIQQPPTPSSDESEPEDSKAGEPSLLDRLRQLASPQPSEFGEADRRKSFSEKVKGRCLRNLSHLVTVISCNYILDPQSTVYVFWLLVVSIVFLYNAWVIPLRAVFPYQTESNAMSWFIADCVADVVYLVDVVAFKPHVKFLQNGFWVKEPKQTMMTYLKSIQCKVDLVALFPVDIISTIFYRNLPLLRLPRILKVETFWELFRRLDTVLANPHRARIFHTCLYMLYMIHMVATSYYGISKWEGIGATTWTFDGRGNAYVRCFYFATKTATSIGKNPKPENIFEYIFMTFAWLSGVFVFAILIGQIRDIIATATKSQTEYRILTSATASYLHRLGVPSRLQNRVKLWLSYTWEQQKTLDETRILNLLPKNMKADIALNIHVETLAKVKLFQDCETAFLRDLVVKLRSIIILPGDFVCKKGEIGREMFIVKSGKIQVIGGPGGTQVLATLAEGSVFGEIALLGIGGMNKRTADVRAAGFVNLFVLNKSDLNEAIRDYPEAQEIMQKKAKKLMKENIKKARASASGPEQQDGSSMDAVSLAESEVIIKNKVETPQLITTVLKLFPPTTKVGQYLTQGSKVGSLSDIAETTKTDDMYTSFTSYPPSPFIPGSPGHISPELDISIMTGDSSDKRLSPPVESNDDTDTGSDGYRSTDQEENNDENEHSVKDDGELISNGDKDKRSNSKRGSVERRDFQEMSSQSYPTPAPPPFQRRDKGGRWRRLSYIPKLSLDSGKGEETIGGARNSCPQLVSTSKRDEIPVEVRPPLYILEPKLSLKKSFKSSSSSTRPRAVEDGRTTTDEKMTNVSEAVPSGSLKKPRAAVIASRFITDLRRPLKRQVEVDVPDVKVESPYSLDIESD